MSVTKDNIITLPNNHLRLRSQKVGIITDEIKQLAADMQQATLDWEDSRNHEIGVALAAVQIDKLYRIVVIRNNFEDKKDRSFLVFINPRITKFEGEILEDYEGCLSIKDIYGKVPRYDKVRVAGIDLNGKEIRINAEGFLARIFQHEIDHTNGKVFIDHIKGKPDAFFTLTGDGSLEPLDYKENVESNNDLWGS